MESFNHFPQIATELDRLQSLAVRKTAFDLQAATQAQIRANDQIDTSFMVNSVYVKTFNESTYGQIEQPTKKGVEPLPEVERPANDKTAFVAMAASYAIFQNYGTKYQAGKPFLEPAIAQVMPDFQAALAAIESQLGAIR